MFSEAFLFLTNRHTKKKQNFGPCALIDLITWSLCPISSETFSRIVDFSLYILKIVSPWMRDYLITSVGMSGCHGSLDNTCKYKYALQLATKQLTECTTGYSYEVALAPNILSSLLYHTLFSFLSELMQKA